MLDARRIQFMRWYFWKPIMISPDIQKLVHFCGAMRLYAKASLIRSGISGGYTCWDASSLFTIHTCVGGLGKEMQVMEVLNPEASCTNCTASQRACLCRLSMRIVHTTATRFAMNLMSCMSANNTPHFLSFHFERTMEEFIMEKPLAHLLLHLVVVQRSSLTGC